MRHPNEELTRRAYDAFSRGDADTLRQVFAENSVFHEPGRNPVSGDHQGIDQVLALFGKLGERSGGTFRVTVHDVVANDEHAVGLHVAEGEREGRRLHSRVLSLQVTSGGSSSQCAPVGRSDAGWNDRWNDVVLHPNAPQPRGLGRTQHGQFRIQLESPIAGPAGPSASTMSFKSVRAP